MRIVIAPLFLLVVLGCGPIRSTVGIVEAEKAWKAAERAGAAQHAPYPFGLSTELLRKAKEEQGFAAYSDAYQLSRESLEQSQEAVKVTAERGASTVATPPKASALAEPPGAPAPPAEATPSPAGDAARENALPPGDLPPGVQGTPSPTPAPAESTPVEAAPASAPAPGAK